MATQKSQTNFLKISEGVDLYTETYGDDGPDKPIMIFVHGLGGTSSIWGALLEACPDLTEKYRVILYDLRGAGLSSSKGIKSHDGSSKEGQITLNLHVEDLLFIVKNALSTTTTSIPSAVPINTITLVGYTMGTYIAQAFVSAYPTLVSTLILISSSLPPFPPQIREFMASWATTIESKGIEGHLEIANMLAPILVPPQSKKNTLARTFVRSAILSQPRESYVKNIRALAEIDYTVPFKENFASIKGKRILVVGGGSDSWGEGSDLVKHLNADAGDTPWAERASVKHVVIEGVGHSLPIEDPESLAVVIREFLT